MRATYALLASLIFVGLSGACTQQPEASVLMSLRRDLPQGTTLRLPGTEPPGLNDAWLTAGEGTPIISFYSVNQPIVSICQAPADQCRTLLPTAQEIPRSEKDVTVLIEAQETGAQMTLSPELTRYWSEVELVAGRPAWLDSR